MTTRTLAALLGLAALTLTSGAALAQNTMATDSGDAKPMKHKMAKHMSMGAHHGGRMARGSGAAREASTDALNGQSLQAAQGGQPMTPMAPK